MTSLSIWIMSFVECNPYGFILRVLIQGGHTVLATRNLRSCSRQRELQPPSHFCVFDRLVFSAEPENGKNRPKVLIFNVAHIVLTVVEDRRADVAPSYNSRPS